MTAISPSQQEEDKNYTKCDAEDNSQETLYFKDGKRRIDFILAYKDKSGNEKDKSNAIKRDIFEKNLKKEGLELEFEDKKNSQSGKIHFVKIHAPWKVLAKGAELKRLKMPIKEYDVAKQNDSCFPFTNIRNPLELSEEIVGEDPIEYFTADFNRSRRDMFIIGDNENTFFSSAQRNLIVYEVLLRTQFSDTKEASLGIERLIKCDAYTSAFPLHDGKYTSSSGKGTSERQLLFNAWAKPARWYNLQPLDHIRLYFGEKVGIYFAWLGHYTMMLILPSIVGFLTFLYGCFSLLTYIPVKDICDEKKAGNYIMCPLCDKRCTYWYLQESCTYAKFTHLFDNNGTVFFAVFMAIWTATFLEFWKRRQAEIQYDWDVAEFEMEEHLRPEYEATCKEKRINPITKEQEPFMSQCSRLTRKVTSIAVILFMIALVICAVFAIIVYRIIIITILYGSSEAIIKRNAKFTTTATAAVINLIVIVLLNKLYRWVALWLTDLERPKTDTEYDDSFTLKMFLFQFINYYSAIFYIAFFKGRTAGYPGSVENYIFGGKYRLDECDPAGCLIELCIQLSIIMVGKQFLNNFTEIMLPKILNWCRARSALKKETTENAYTRWEQDNDLQTCPNLVLFDEYLEMVIQYGFITIFVAAFPLAPLFALLNNIIEIRLDAYKFVTQYRRPIAHRAQDIGIWFGILKGISFIAILSSAFIIGWTSDFIPRVVYSYETGINDQKGYVNRSLSVFDVKDYSLQSKPDTLPDGWAVVSECRYPDHRFGPNHSSRYEFTTTHWRILVARLSFIILFEHLIFFLTWLVNYIIPDVSNEVRQLMLREMFLAKAARYKEHTEEHN